MYMKPSCSANFHFPMVYWLYSAKFHFHYISTWQVILWFFLFQTFSIQLFQYMFSDFQYTKGNYRRKTAMSQFGSVSEQGTETTIHKETAILFPPNVSQMLSYWSTDCAAESFKPRVILHDQRGNQPSKNRENMDFSSDSARILAFSTHWHEANKSNRQREERPIGSRTVKMLRDLQRRVRSLAADSRTACGGGERARCM